MTKANETYNAAHRLLNKARDLIEAEAREHAESEVRDVLDEAVHDIGEILRTLELMLGIPKWMVEEDERLRLGYPTVISMGQEPARR